MTANVSVVWAQVDDALRVPNAALRFRPGADLVPAPDAGAAGERRSREGRGEDGRGEGKVRPKQAWVLRGQALVKVKLETGVTDGSYTEVTGGDLTEGDLVVTESNDPGKASGGGGSSSPLAPQQAPRGMRRVL